MPHKPTTRRALVEIGRLHPSDHNPRKYHDPAAHEDLKRSLADVGQLVPLLVRLSPRGGDELEIVCGERRWRAAKDLGWQRIEAIYDQRLDGNHQLAYQATAAENLERSPLNAYEETIAILTLLVDQLSPLPKWPDSDDPITTAADLMQRFVRGDPERRRAIATGLGTTPEALEAAIEQACRKRVGLKPESVVSNRLPLLTLPDDVLQALEEGAVPYTSAVQVARVPDPATRAALLEQAQTYSVRAMQDIVRAHLKAAPATPDRNAQRVTEAKRLLAEINARSRTLETLDYNATTAVLTALKSVRARLERK